VTATPEPGAPAEEAAPAPEVLLQHAQRVAVLGVLADDAKNAYMAARAAAEPLFALARKLGVKQQAVMLPGNVEAGMLSLKAGTARFDVHEEDLILLVAAGLPSEIEDYALPPAEHDPRVVRVLAEHVPDLIETRVMPGGLDDERAVKILGEHLPELVGRRIRPTYRADLQKEIETHEGYVPDPATGERVQVADVTHSDPDGSFTHVHKAKYAGRVRDALASGALKITGTGDVIAGEESPR
jgi:hypothetical protein